MRPAIPPASKLKPNVSRPSNTLLTSRRISFSDAKQSTGYPCMHRLRIIILIGLGICYYTSAISDELRDTVESAQNTHGISAVAYFIVSPDSVEALETLGTTDTDNGIPFAPDHLVRIGSITKTFTALATIILHERNLVSLDSPVADVLDRPVFVNPWSDRRPLKIVHLLEHTAGLRDLSKREFDFNQPVLLDAAFKVDPDSRRLRWPPGMYSSYSNSGAGILSAVIEHTAGQTYETFVSKEIFNFLGMSSARFTVPDFERHRLVTGYDSDARTPIPYWHILYYAFGAISVTPRDMIFFVQLFLNDGKHGNRRLVAKASMQNMRSPTTTLAARSGLGYGLGLYQYQRHGVSFFGHGGDADGYLAYFAFSPAFNRGYFVAINAFNPSALLKIRQAIEEKIIGHAAPKKIAAATISNEQLQKLSGTYRPVTARFGKPSDNKFIKVSAATDGELYTSLQNGRRRALLSVTSLHFRRRGQTVATVAFIACGDQIHLQGDFGNYAKSAQTDVHHLCINSTTP